MRISKAKKLLNLFSPKFKEIDGCVLLAEAVPTAGFDVSSYHDRTEAEAFVNHVHILDRFKHKAGLKREPLYDARHRDCRLGAKLGKAIAHSWAAQLALQFPHGRFRVYYTQDDNPIVRFHSVRNDECPWLDEGDWIEARDAGRVLVISVGPADSN